MNLKISCNGQLLNVERLGRGAKLLFCNRSSFSIAAIRNLLEKLSDHFDLLTFDYRGMGESEPVTKDYSMADVSADAIGLLDAFNWDSCLLAGWSFGGMVGIPGGHGFFVEDPAGLEDVIHFLEHGEFD